MKDFKLRPIECAHCCRAFYRCCKSTGRSRCPHCRKNTPRDKRPSQEEIAKLLCQRKAAKANRIAGRMNMNALMDMDAIKAHQIPSSLHEGLFKSRCAEKGWRAHRPSWPDFIVEIGSRMIAVEVKSRSDRVSTTQRATFDLLERMGVPVYLWRNSKDGQSKLVRWIDSVLK